MADVSCTRCRWGYFDTRGQWSGCPDCGDDFPTTSSRELADARGLLLTVGAGAVIGLLALFLLAWVIARGAGVA